MHKSDYLLFTLTFGIINKFIIDICLKNQENNFNNKLKIQEDNFNNKYKIYEEKINQHNKRLLYLYPLMYSWNTKTTSK